jgi:hypothetical protein
MLCEVEISSFDLRYEGRRLRNRTQEGRLLSSMAERGIDEALEGVDAGDVRVLLNGFKRYRCARKLGLSMVPYTSLGTDAAGGIVALLRIVKTNNLHVLEQAGFIDELRGMEQLSVSQIAGLLSRSKGWVSMRMGILAQMSEAVRRELFSGRFPAYAYLYTLRPFMRMNGVGSHEVEELVVALGGKKLSVREIALLAHGFFRGPDAFREQIRAGNVAVALDRIRQVPDDPDEGCSVFERGMLRDLELTGKTIQRVMGKSTDTRLKSRAFHAEANLVTAGILSRSGAFIKTLRSLHDRSGQA